MYGIVWVWKLIAAHPKPNCRWLIMQCFPSIALNSFISLWGPRYHPLTSITMAEQIFYDILVGGTVPVCIQYIKVYYIYIQLCIHHIYIYIYIYTYIHYISTILCIYIYIYIIYLQLCVYINIYIYIYTWRTKTLRILRVNARTWSISEKIRKPDFRLKTSGIDFEPVLDPYLTRT